MLYSSSLINGGYDTLDIINMADGLSGFSFKSTNPARVTKIWITKIR